MPMGAAGVSAAASRVFFSYIGFDAASTAGEEARNPKRDLPRAILLSMLIVTTIYVLVAVAAIGARPWGWFDGTEAALVKILEETTGQPWVGVVFAVGAVLAIASIVLTVLYGQTRILLSMARDGLVPRIFGRVSPRTGTPVAGTLIVGTAVALTAGLVPLGALADATSIGTLFAFALVNVAVIYLRRTRPELKRSFRVPLFPLTPILGALMCAYLMANLGAETWAVFGIWMLVGVAAYFGYGRRNSRVAALSHEEYRELSEPANPPTTTHTPRNHEGRALMTIATELPAPDPSRQAQHLRRHATPAQAPRRSARHHAQPGFPVQLRPLPGPSGRPGLGPAGAVRDRGGGHRRRALRAGDRLRADEAGPAPGRLRSGPDRRPAADGELPLRARRRRGPRRHALPGLRQGLLPLRGPARAAKPRSSRTRWRRRRPAR